MTLPNKEILMEGTPKLIIDTDMSIDDMMVILYLLNRQDIDISGISVVGTGVCHCTQGAQNALRLLRLAGKETAGIPVACGEEQPVDGFHSFPDAWRVMADTLFGVPLPDSSVQPVDQPAVELLHTLLTHSPSPVPILCIGPLTNIAELLEQEPAIHAKIERLIIMAGAFRVEGKAISPGLDAYLKSVAIQSVSLGNDAADWNAYADPLAAQIVFRSGVPITLAPIDTTNLLPLTEGFVAAFRDRARSPEANFLQSVFDHETELIKIGGYYFWDNLAAAAVVDRDLLKFKPAKLDVVVQYSSDGIVDPRFSLTRKDGQPRRALDLHVSGQIVEADEAQASDVCVDVNAPAFYERFIQVINHE